MVTLFTTSFILYHPNPDYLKVGEYFEDLIKGEFFDLQINEHPDYDGDVQIFSITYPAYRSHDYTERMMSFCAESMKVNKALKWFDEWIKNGDYTDFPF